MLSRVANRLSHTFFMICMTSRLFGTPRIFQYGKSQKTDLVFHTFSSGSGAFCFFPGGGHSFQFFNSSSISSPLLVCGGLWGSVSPSNRSLRFLHASSSRSPLRCPMNMVLEDQGSLSSWRYVVSSMHLTHAQSP